VLEQSFLMASHSWTCLLGVVEVAMPLQSVSRVYEAIGCLELCEHRHTSLLAVNIDLDIGLFKRSPFKVLLVATAFDFPLGTLLTGRFLFAALETLRFAGYAA
jgi:hypothetical protein